MFVRMWHAGHFQAQSKIYDAQSKIYDTQSKIYDTQQPALMHKLQDTPSTRVYAMTSVTYTHQSWAFRHAYVRMSVFEPEVNQLLYLYVYNYVYDHICESSLMNIQYVRLYTYNFYIVVIVSYFMV